MKKVSLVMLLLMASLLLATCGSGTSDGRSDGTAPKTAPEVKADDPMALPWGGTAVLNGLEVVVTEPLDETDSLTGFDAEFLDEGVRAFASVVTITNTGSEVYGYNPLSFTLFDTDGRTWDALMGTTSRPPLDSADLLPSKTVSGAIAFDLPVGVMPSYVLFQRDIMADTEAHWGD